MLKENDSNFKSKQKKNFDKNKGAKSLPELKPGDKVLMQTEKGDKGYKIPGEIKEKCQAPRSYIVSTPGGERRRNRKHLKAIPEHSEQSEPQVDVAPEPPEHSEPQVDIAPPIPDTTTLPVPDTSYTTRSGRVVKTPGRFQDYVMY